MWAEVNGERKKVACGPCIRGHRSSKCDHRDRVLVEVRKPGRPLSSCPHPSGSCSCERIVINYTIPKSSECACPSELEIEPPTATVVGNSRIQKNRRRPTLINTINASSLEKAVIQAAQDAATDASSHTCTPTERSGSNEASPMSSASSTPRLLPAQKSVSSCCKPQPPQSPVQEGGCCGSKVKQLPESVPPKSCCSGPKPRADTIPNGQLNVYQQLGQQAQFQHAPQFQVPQYQNFQSTASAPSPATLPFGFYSPIYNHAAAAYQQTSYIPMNPAMSGSMSLNTASPQVGQYVPEHNCHCGDSCSCFGCAAHPNNPTMLEYVREIAQFQYAGDLGAMSQPLYDMPTYPHHPGFGAEAFSPMPQGMVTPTIANTVFQGNMNMSVLPNTPMSVSGPWQPPLSAPMVPESQFLEPPSYATPTSMEGQLQLKQEEHVSSPIADNCSDGKGEETSTLSPSSYLWTQMVLPGCSDATGTCQCGDGCACDGCLTHGGHNGVPYEASVISDRDAFSDFTTDTGETLDNTINFTF